MKRWFLPLSVLFVASVALWVLGGLRSGPAAAPVGRAQREVATGSPPAERGLTAPVGDMGMERVECPLLEEPAMQLSLRLVELDSESMEPLTTVDARIRQGAVRFRPSNADVGVGTLIGDGIEPKMVVWALGVCTEDVELVLHPHFDVVAMVSGDADVEDVYVRMRCDTPRSVSYEGGRSSGDGGALHFRGVLHDRCVLEASRYHGSLRLVSDLPVASTTEPQEVLVEVPPLPATGVAGYVDQGGVRIDAIAPGSRGQRAGLKLRDLVFPDEPVDDVLEWADGDAPIPVVVERDGERFDTTL